MLSLNQRRQLNDGDWMQMLCILKLLNKSAVSEVDYILRNPCCEGDSIPLRSRNQTNLAFTIFSINLHKQDVRVIGL